jgi:hypothetical protein
MLASMATICNATIHRFLFITELFAENYYKIPKLYVNSAMFFVQILWPLSGAILTSRVEMRPENVVNESKKVKFFEIQKNVVMQNLALPRHFPKNKWGTMCVLCKWIY